MVILRSEVPEQDAKDPIPSPRPALAARVFPRNALLFILSVVAGFIIGESPVQGRI